MSNHLTNSRQGQLEQSLGNDKELSAATGLLTRRSYKIKVLVNALRLVSEDIDIAQETLLIPEGCEQYGFVEGYHDLGICLHFLADMLEE